MEYLWWWKIPIPPGYGKLLLWLTFWITSFLNGDSRTFAWKGSHTVNALDSFGPTVTSGMRFANAVDAGEFVVALVNGINNYKAP